MQTMNPKDIQTHPTFSSLFPMNPEILDAITDDMRNGRYDRSQPIILARWEGQEDPVCIDGHTRLKAAVASGIEEVPVFLHEFMTEEDALNKSILLQRNRRNMTDAELMQCIDAVDKIRSRGGDRRSTQAKSKPQGCGNGRSASAKETAKILGCSTRKVEQARSVAKHADPQTLDAVKNGNLTINAANDTIRKKKRATKSENPRQSEQASTTTVPEAKPADEVSAWGSDALVETYTVYPATVTLTAEQLEQLGRLGGEIEFHISQAVDRYLWAFHQQCEDLDSIWYQEPDFEYVGANQ